MLLYRQQALSEKEISDKMSTREGSSKEEEVVVSPLAGLATEQVNNVEQSCESPTGLQTEDSRVLVGDSPLATTLNMFIFSLVAGASAASAILIVFAAFDYYYRWGLR